jgi:hypothetical protein
VKKCIEETFPTSSITNLAPLSLIKDLVSTRMIPTSLMALIEVPAGNPVLTLEKEGIENTVPTPG